ATPPPAARPPTRSGPCSSASTPPCTRPTTSCCARASTRAGDATGRRRQEPFPSAAQHPPPAPIPRGASPHDPPQHRVHHERRPRRPLHLRLRQPGQHDPAHGPPRRRGRPDGRRLLHELHLHPLARLDPHRHVLPHQPRPLDLLRVRPPGAHLPRGAAGVRLP